MKAVNGYSDEEERELIERLALSIFEDEITSVEKIARHLVREVHGWIADGICPDPDRQLESLIEAEAERWRYQLGERYAEILTQRLRKAIEDAEKPWVTK